VVPKKSICQDAEKVLLKEQQFEIIILEKVRKQT